MVILLIGLFSSLTLSLLLTSGLLYSVTGFCINRKSYLYPEEALLLAERSVLLVEHEGERIEYHKFYEIVIGHVSLECHLAYLKLKSLDYLVFRNSGTVKSFEGDDDVHKELLEHPEHSLFRVRRRCLTCYRSLQSTKIVHSN